MITYLQRLTAERDSLTQSATHLTETAAAEDRDLTDTEAASMRGWSERCAQIDAQLVEYNAQAEATRAYAQLHDRLVAGDPAPSGLETRTAGAALETRSVGDGFVASDAFRSYTGHGQSGIFEAPSALETRAAITTAQLSIPHFVWAPIEQQFQSILLNVIGRVQVSSGVVDWVEIGPDPVAAVVAEGSAKPEAAFTLTPRSGALDTLAHWVQITRQALDDAAYIRSLIESKLRRGLLAKAEADVGTAIDAAATQTNTASTAAGGTLLTAIRGGVGKVQAAGYNPNAVLLNPGDFAALDVDVMGKTDTGPIISQSFWGLTPVAATSIPAGKAYVGDFQQGVTLFDRGVTNVFLSDSHASLFISNILVILAEARVKSVVTEPLAICECSVVA